MREERLRRWALLVAQGTKKWPHGSGAVEGVQRVIDQPNLCGCSRPLRLASLYLERMILRNLWCFRLSSTEPFATTLEQAKEYGSLTRMLRVPDGRLWHWQGRRATQLAAQVGAQARTRTAQAASARTRGRRPPSRRERASRRFFGLRPSAAAAAAASRVVGVRVEWRVHGSSLVHDEAQVADPRRPRLFCPALQPQGSTRHASQLSQKMTATVPSPIFEADHFQIWAPLAGRPAAWSGHLLHSNGSEQ